MQNIPQSFKCNSIFFGDYFFTQIAKSIQLQGFHIKNFLIGFHFNTKIPHIKIIAKLRGDVPEFLRKYNLLFIIGDREWSVAASMVILGKFRSKIQSKKYSKTKRNNKI